MRLQMTKYIFITGGVVSSLGKGIVGASLGKLLRSKGFTVAIQKFDPYINVDPGTMSPFQHGEVFVTDDGAETDLDLGHYERFIDSNFSQFIIPFSSILVNVEGNNNVSNSFNRCLLGTCCMKITVLGTRKIGIYK